MSVCGEVRRARPLLGTLVEISAAHPDAAQLEAGVSAAFASIERVHRLMSFHDPESDLSRLNREAADHLVAVDEWTYEVLAAAADLHRETDGAFDIAIAPTLVRLGYLPGAPTAASGTTADIELQSGRRVRFRRPLQIDLGGIAKGFAVDQAVAALRQHKLPRGSVNAGGDLRVFGRAAQLIHVRHPANPGDLIPLAQLRNEALATSAPYFSRKRLHQHWVSPFIDPRTNRPCTDDSSFSVRAPTCLLADALTKVVIVLGSAAKHVLNQRRAVALCLTPGGEAVSSAAWT